MCLMICCSSTWSKRFFPILREWQQECTIQNKHCLFIWRTSVPGHPNCMQYSEPSTSLTEMEDLVRNQSIDPRYNWNKFSIQNELILNALYQANLTHEVMDAYFVNILWPDMHQGNDCLHTVRRVFDQWILVATMFQTFVHYHSHYTCLVFVLPPQVLTKGQHLQLAPSSHVASQVQQ